MLPTTPWFSIPSKLMRGLARSGAHGPGDAILLPICECNAERENLGLLMSDSWSFHDHTRSVPRRCRCRDSHICGSVLDPPVSSDSSQRASEHLTNGWAKTYEQLGRPRNSPSGAALFLARWIGNWNGDRTRDGAGCD